MMKHSRIWSQKVKSLVALAPVLGAISRPVLCWFSDTFLFPWTPGIIKAIQLDYSEAHKNLLQAIRKAPQQAAIGFKQTVSRLNQWQTNFFLFFNMVIIITIELLIETYGMKMKADAILGPAVTEWQNNRDTEDSTLMSSVAKCCNPISVKVLGCQLCVNINFIQRTIFHLVKEYMTYKGVTLFQSMGICYLWYFGKKKLKVFLTKNVVTLVFCVLSKKIPMLLF